MSIYPVIPITQFYNNAVTYDPRAAKVELGKGGVLDRSRIHFFNNTRKSYFINAVLKDKDTLQNFLEVNRGKPFEFRYDGVTSSGLYVCKTWSWDWIVYTDSVSGVWNFSATFEQVFRPGWVSNTTGLGTLTLGAITVTGTGEISSAGLTPGALYAVKYGGGTFFNPNTGQRTTSGWTFFRHLVGPVTIQIITASANYKYARLTGANNYIDVVLETNWNDGTEQIRGNQYLLIREDGE